MNKAVGHEMRAVEGKCGVREQMLSVMAILMKFIMQVYEVNYAGL